MRFCFLKEKSVSLGTSYKTKDVFIRSSYCYMYYCEKPAGDVESHSLHVKVSDFAPYVREFELSVMVEGHFRLLWCFPFAFRVRSLY